MAGSKRLSVLSRGLGLKSGKKSAKYKFDVVVEKLDNLPIPVKKCRVVWSRGPKVQMTDVKDVTKGAVSFKQKLSQIATMYHGSKGGWEAKEYKFQVQVPAKEDNKMMTVGRAELDMAQYVLAEGSSQSKMIPILFKVGMASTGYLKVSITAEAVESGAGSDDGMTEVSGMTGMTTNLGEDQDLTGFEEDKSAQASSGTHSGTQSRPSSRLSTAAAPTKPDSKAAPSFSTPSMSTANTSRSQPAPKGQDEEDISPMSLSPSSSTSTSPRETSTKPTRPVGKQSTVATAAAAAEARAQLFGTSSNKPTPAASSGRSGVKSKQDTPLTEDEARAALFGASGPSKGSSAAATAAAPSPSSKPAPAPDPSRQASTSKAPLPAAGAAVASTSAASAASPSRASSIAASEASITPGAPPVVRRALLDRSSLQTKQQALAAAPVPDTGPSSSNLSPAPPQNSHGHSLSDSDDDRSSAKKLTQQAGLSRTLPSTAAANRPWQQQQQQGTPASDGASVTAKVLSAENEKLKAQLVALRQQAAEAEESRRMAVLAAENAASERDEYQGQVQELQEQLKEALVSLMTPEEAAELRQQAQDQRSQLAQQQEQRQQQEAALEACQAERSRLQEQLTDAQQAATAAQQEAALRVQKMQEEADSHAGLLRHLSWQLEAAQEALQQQQQQQEQPPSSSTDAAAADAVQLAAAEGARPAAEVQCAKLLQLLVDEAQALSQHSLVQHCITDQLLAAASSAVANLSLEGALQGAVMEVLSSLQAAAAALQQQDTERAVLQDQVMHLTAAVSEAEQAAQELSQRASVVASSAAADAQRLQAELEQLRTEVVQLRQHNQQLTAAACGPVAPKLTVKAGALQLEGDGATGSPSIKAGLRCAETPSSSDLDVFNGSPTAKEQAMLQQLTAMRHQVARLTAARDKLEIILHDLEATAVEEREQLEHQLAAANQALRSTTQQLASAQQQAAGLQQELAGLQQQVSVLQLQLDQARQQQEVLQQQAADAAAELQAQRQQAGPEAAAAAAAGPAAQVIALAENAAPSGVEQALAASQERVAELQRQLAEADSGRRVLEKDLSRLRKQLAEEQAERSTLEEQLVTRLEDSGDDVAQETVAAYEAKYNRLKSRYREMAELHREEVDKLHEEIAALQERVVELEALAAQLEAAQAQAHHGELTLADTLAKASKASSELAALRADNQMLMQGLVAAKLELAQCSEREIIGRHELYKARESNLKLASKMTKLETLVYASKK